MPMTINTNIQSLNAQRNLANSQSALATSMQRLSSGLRINSAKDDAAGVAIAERMNAQIRGINQAQRNANDGVSLAQTAEGALGTVGNNLQRIRELAVQSRNATNSLEDRTALQKEVQQLKDEIERVASTTAFNGTKLLDGSFTAKDFQVGANMGERISIDSIVNARGNALGSFHELTSTGLSEPTTKATKGAANAAPTAAEFAAIAADAITIKVGNDEFKLKEIAAIKVKPAVNDDASVAEADKAAVAQRLADVAQAIGEATGGRVAASVGSDGKLSLSSLEEFSITGTTTGTGIDAAADKVVAHTGYADVSVMTAESSDLAILAMDAALRSVNSARADLGAIQNRFESVVSNLAVSSENLTASKSRVMDADFATETANLSRAQILQQAGTAMVAQANQAPQGVLSLLR